MSNKHYRGSAGHCGLLVMMIQLALTATAFSQTKHIFRADCLCQNSNGYINAQFYNKPGLGDLRVGDLAEISAGTCYDLSVCPEHKALIGTTTIKVDGWTENTYMAYKFDMHGVPYSAPPKPNPSTTTSAPASQPSPNDGPCPYGFRYIGRLEGKAHDVKIRPSIHVPFPLDESYQQPPQAGYGCQGGATSILRTQRIPPGIHIIPSGDCFDYGWAVSDPVLNGNNDFSMYLYCSPGSGLTQQFTECRVTVEVCGKPRSAPPTHKKLSLNLAEYCLRRGFKSVINLNGTRYGWRCVPGNVVISYSDACREQYGEAYNTDPTTSDKLVDWYCDRAPIFQLGPPIPQ